MATRPSSSKSVVAIAKGPRRRRRLPASASIVDSVQPRARPIGWRRKAATVRLSMREPEVPLVIERKVAVVKAAVGRKIEQHQPSQARGENQARDSPRERRSFAHPMAGADPATATQTSANAAAPSKPSTNGAGAAKNVLATRPGWKSRSAPKGHGTRPIHAASAQTKSASAMPASATRPRRLSLSSSSPASIHAAHCQPAVRSRSRIAWFFAACRRAARASPMTAADWASASPSANPAQGPLAAYAVPGRFAVAAIAGTAPSPSSAAPSSSSVVAGAASSRSGLSARARARLSLTRPTAQESGRGSPSLLRSSA